MYIWPNIKTSRHQISEVQSIRQVALSSHFVLFLPAFVHFPIYLSVILIDDSWSSSLQLTITLKIRLNSIRSKAFHCSLIVIISRNLSKRRRMNHQFRTIIYQQKRANDKFFFFLVITISFNLAARHVVVVWTNERENVYTCIFFFVLLVLLDLLTKTR